MDAKITEALEAVRKGGKPNCPGCGAKWKEPEKCECGRVRYPNGLREWECGTSIHEWQGEDHIHFSDECWQAQLTKLRTLAQAALDGWRRGEDVWKPMQKLQAVLGGEA